ncbi:MAG: SpoIIE family protein phosphatase [Bacteroidota bacterium]
MKKKKMTVLSKVSSIWQAILNKGVTADITNLEKRKVRLLNTVLVIGQIIFFILLIKSYLQGLTYEVYPQLVGSFLFGIPLLFNFAGRYKIARYLCVFVPYIYLTGLSVYWGASRGSQLIIFGSAALAILFFENKKTVNVLFLTGMVFLLAAHVLSWSIPQFYQSPNEQVSFLLNLVITAIMLYFIFNIFKTENYKFQQELSHKNKSITDSILYAGRIQSSILGDSSTLYTLMPKSYIIYHPKDIVSGDFYWFGEKDGKKIIVASDCTGHGVPGAFMTVLGTSLLNEIVHEKGTLEPEEILYQLDEKVKYALQVNSNVKSNDGMDIGILVIDEANHNIAYAGAKHTLYGINEGEFKVIKSSRYSIGGHEGYNKDFKNISITYQPGDKFYLATDGFQDQFNPEGRKYMKGNFKDLLHKVSTKPMEEQKLILEEEFGNWKRNEPQTDDVLIVGLCL